VAGAFLPSGRSVTGRVFLERLEIARLKTLAFPLPLTVS
jgi:hypothetical protein